MASPYKLYGGATRPDAITGLDPAFNAALLALYNAAPPEVQRELGLNSAYRSNAVQQELWEKSDKTGKRVARPGTSKHEFGKAADLFGFGLTKDRVSQATRDWVTKNAAAYGLYFPMDYEPWHIQLKEVDAQLKAAGYTPEQRRNAIAAIESGGSGDYAALGAVTGEDRDRAYGRYGVMGKNIGPWAGQYLKQAGVTPEQFLKSPKLQDALFDAVFGDYVGKYGERGAASKWFTGSENEPLRSDVHGKLTGRSYADAYMEQLARGGPAAATGKEAEVPLIPGAGQYSKDTGYKPPENDLLADLAKGRTATGGGYAGMSGGMGNVGGFPEMPAQVGAARVDQPAVATLDPQQAEYRRQMLAQVLARLNQGSLV